MALVIVITTISCATRNDKVGIILTPGFQWEEVLKVPVQFQYE